MKANTGSLDEIKVMSCGRAFAPVMQSCLRTLISLFRASGSGAVDKAVRQARYVRARPDIAISLPIPMIWRPRRCRYDRHGDGRRRRRLAEIFIMHWPRRGRAGAKIAHAKY